MAFGAHPDELYVSVFGGIMKRCVFMPAVTVDFRPGCQKNLEANRLMDVKPRPKLA